MTPDAGLEASVPQTPDWQRRTFGERERVVVRALVETVLDDGRGQELSSRFDWVVPEVDRLVSHASGRVRVAYRVTLLLLQWAPLLVGLRGARLTSCAPAERLAILERLEQHPIALLRLLLVPWKTALAIVYFEHPEALGETGYDDTCATGAPRRAGILGVIPRGALARRR